ncbi:rhomboid family intramembrane serine protease GlpG [Pseudoalteromonas fenneropenaei]|uniref:Rhomboid family intramembrane serine protease GlpG n=1 Tax=Pseudoalteromonas fenneropenaei TaxID=1737459 RepID=A0ABV7CNF7_9GAMM
MSGLRRELVLLGEYHQPRLLQGVVDYLQLQKIVVVVEPIDPQRAQVYVDAAQLDSARVIWQQFLNDPHASCFAEAAWQLGRSDTIFQYQGQSLNLVKRALALNPFVALIGVMCLAIFVALNFVAPNSVFAAFKFNPELAYRWLTPALLHFGALHLIFNLMWWLYLGDKLAKRYGTLLIVTLSIGSAAISNWAQYLMVDGNFGGLSGVVYALFGFAWVVGLRDKQTPVLIQKPLFGFMLLWLVFGFTDLFFISMANWAHLFGLLSGALLGALWPCVKLNDTSTS